jgi:hypothetical protein
LRKVSGCWRLISEHRPYFCCLESFDKEMYALGGVIILVELGFMRAIFMARFRGT